MTQRQVDRRPVGPWPEDDYRRIERAIAFLRGHRARPPGPQGLAAHLGLSEADARRLFERWAGMGPEGLAQFLSVGYARCRMAETADLLGQSPDIGLSVSMEAMSPDGFRRAVAGVRIRCGLGGTPFGTALIAFTPRGICHLSFVDPGCADAAVQALRQAWPEARLLRDERAGRSLLARLFAAPGGPRPADAPRLWVSGSRFQIQVWRALLAVPSGGLLSYRGLAGLLGRPGAARAVGAAVARNPVAYLIPCHRVLRGSGDFGDYHWGAVRKMAICAWEAAAARA